MSSATAPARASSRSTTRHGWLAGPLRLPGHHLLPPRLRDGGPGRLRADHGAVGLGDRVDRLLQGEVGLHDLPQPGRLRGHRRGRARRRLADVGRCLEAPRAAHPGGRVRARSCSCSPRWAPTSAATRTGSGSARSPCSRPRSSRSGWCSPVASSCRRSARPALAQPRARALPRPGRGREHRGRRARPRPGHRAHPRARSSRACSSPRGSRCAGSPSPAARSS